MSVHKKSRRSVKRFTAPLLALAIVLAMSGAASANDETVESASSSESAPPAQEKKTDPAAEEAPAPDPALEKSEPVEKIAPAPSEDETLAGEENLSSDEPANDEKEDQQTPYIETSNTVQCGVATITLHNVSAWIYPVTVEIDGVESYGPTVDNRTDGKLDGPIKDRSATRTITFPEDSGTHTVRYRVAAGSERDLYRGLPVGEWTNLTVESDCEPPCVEASTSTLAYEYNRTELTVEVKNGKSLCEDFTFSVARWTYDSTTAFPQTFADKGVATLKANEPGVSAAATVSDGCGQFDAYANRGPSEGDTLTGSNDPYNEVFINTKASGDDVPYTVDDPASCEVVNPPVEVVPANVTSSDICGVDDDTITVPSNEGVMYKIDGEPTESGTFPATGVVVVTAEATEGYVLKEGTTKSWTFEFTDEPCDLTSPVVTVDSKCGVIVVTNGEDEELTFSYYDSSNEDDEGVTGILVDAGKTVEIKTDLTDVTYYAYYAKSGRDHQGSVKVSQNCDTTTPVSDNPTPPQANTMLPNTGGLPLAALPLGVVLLFGGAYLVKARRKSLG